MRQSASVRINAANEIFVECGLDVKDDFLFGCERSGANNAYWSVGTFNADPKFKINVSFDIVINICEVG